MTMEMLPTRRAGIIAALVLGWAASVNAQQPTNGRWTIDRIDGDTVRLTGPDAASAEFGLSFRVFLATSNPSPAKTMVAGVDYNGGTSWVASVPDPDSGIGGGDNPDWVDGFDPDIVTNPGSRTANLFNAAASREIRPVSDTVEADGIVYQFAADPTFSFPARLGFDGETGAPVLTTTLESTGTAWFSVAYIARRITDLPESFNDPDASLFFWTGYAPRFVDLLLIHEATNEPRFLDAAWKAARFFAMHCWCAPRIPDEDITVNQGGVAPTYWYLQARTIAPIAVPEETVPAWRISAQGLTCESSGTSTGHRAIFMANYAPWFLRLARLKGRADSRTTAAGGAGGGIHPARRRFGAQRPFSRPRGRHAHPRHNRALLDPQRGGCRRVHAAGRGHRRFPKTRLSKRHGDRRRAGTA